MGLVANMRQAKMVTSYKSETNAGIMAMQPEHVVRLTHADQCTQEEHEQKPHDTPGIPQV